MTNSEQRLRNQMAWLVARPRLLRATVSANRVLTGAGYALYPLLIVLVALGQPRLLVAYLGVPAASFLLLSIVRRRIDAPRPYQVYDIAPLIPKDTRGRSMPSRHVFSIVTIGVCWLGWCAPVGIILLVASVPMAAIRVVCGVHFTRDVLVGGVCGILAGALALWCAMMLAV